MDRLGRYVSDDDLAYEPFRERGWAVEAVPWRRPDVDWDRYEAVVIRSTWDYHKDPQAFLAVLEGIDRSRARLANPLSLVRWNLRKTYLRDLAARGIPIVPTHWGQGLEAAALTKLFDVLQTEDLVVKPVVSASAGDTFRLRRGDAEGMAGTLEAIFRERAYMAQPFMPQMVEEGEYSLFYFGGVQSHTVQKVPKAGDFRVQEEHGAVIQAVAASAALAAWGRRVVQAVTPPPLYARVDGVRDAAGGFALMELELIEPALYLRKDPGAARRFARAFDAWMAEGLV